MWTKGEKMNSQLRPTGGIRIQNQSSSRSRCKNPRSFSPDRANSWRGNHHRDNRHDEAISRIKELRIRCQRRRESLVKPTKPTKLTATMSPVTTRSTTSKESIKDTDTIASATVSTHEGGN